MNTDKFAFLYSPRFWAMTLGAMSVILISDSFPTDLWYVSIGKFLGLWSAGFVGVGTYDRTVDKIAQAGTISTASTTTKKKKK